MNEDGIDTNEVEKSLREKDFDSAYLIPLILSHGFGSNSQKDGIKEVPKIGSHKRGDRKKYSVIGP
ncbi:Transcriptional regulator, GntR family / TYROSINE AMINOTRANSFERASE [Bacillus thuringiensis serovar israelensis ATCC 35646]|nr:Transcriptional regulator, GntR family / TYROSINE AMINOTRANSFERASE [Bacillus thuringiensis serovar israelensis ATCC 35646]